jgi:hypothetical protein
MCCDPCAKNLLSLSLCCVRFEPHPRRKRPRRSLAGRRAYAKVAPGRDRAWPEELHQHPGLGCSTPARVATGRFAVVGLARHGAYGPQRPAARRGCAPAHVKLMARTLAAVQRWPAVHRADTEPPGGG